MATKAFYPNSSLIDEVRYDMESKKLTIIFGNGGEYEYDSVPYPIYLGLKGAPSTGSYFHSHVKNKFSFEKVT